MRFQIEPIEQLSRSIDKSPTLHTKSFLINPWKTVEQVDLNRPKHPCETINIKAAFPVVYLSKWARVTGKISVIYTYQAELLIA